MSNGAAVEMVCAPASSKRALQQHVRPRCTGSSAVAAVLERVVRSVFGQIEALSQLRAHELGGRRKCRCRVSCWRSRVHLLLQQPRALLHFVGVSGRQLDGVGAGKLKAKNELKMRKYLGSLPGRGRAPPLSFQQHRATETTRRIFCA